MNKKLMTQIETLCGECKSLEKARERFPGDWKLPKEADFQSWILQSLAEWRKAGNLPKGTFWWKESASPYQRKGIPDILMVVAGTGRLCAFEVKRPFVGRASDAQKMAIIELRAAGAVAAIVSFPSEVRDILQKEGIYK